MRRSHSYSKRDALETCPRRYFYEYYASAKRVAYDPKRGALIRQLKDLSNSYLLAGSILHRLIKKRLTNGRTWSDGWFLGKGPEWFDNDLAYASDPESNAHRKNERFPPKMLVEFYYRDARAEEIAAEARRRLVRAISNFLREDEVVQLRDTLLAGHHLVEKRINGLELDGYTIQGQVDFVGFDSRRVHIVDWKMGLPEGDQDSLQLFTYGWWASQKFSVKPTDVLVQRVFLGSATVEKERRLDERTLRRGKARLIQDIELMKELDPYGQAGNETAFSPCEREGVCHLCKYQEVCS